MLNIELARIVIAERRRTTDENLRQARFERDLAERNGAAAESPQAERDASPAPCADAGQRIEPALG